MNYTWPRLCSQANKKVPRARGGRGARGCLLFEAWLAVFLYCTAALAGIGVGVPVCSAGFTRRKSLRLPEPIQPAGRGGTGKDQSDVNFPSAKAGDG